MLLTKLSKKLLKYLSPIGKGMIIGGCILTGSVLKLEKGEIID